MAASKMILVLQLTIGLSFAFGIDCSAYTCKTPDQVWYPNQCGFNNNITNTYYVQPCQDSSLECYPDQQHSTSYQFNYTCQETYVPPVNSYPGEWCKTDDDCAPGLSLTCQNGICVGVSNGEYCSWSEQCNPGLRCTNNTCIPQLQIGESGCTWDYDCVNNAACNIISYSNPSQNTCYGFHSFKVHDEVGECYSGFHTLCQYYYCAQNSDGKSYCTDLFYTLQGPGSQCDVNGRGCYSNKDSFFTPPYSIEGECDCGLNSEGNSYCEVLPGDAPNQQWLNIFNEWVNSPELLNCNTVKRFDSNCVQTYWSSKQYNAFVYYNLQSSLYNRLVGIEDCVLNAFAENYVQARNAFNNSNVEAVAF
ncbi:unnamed protein product [Blepharisma stoltei]|uniref:Dickkopf N-terminal cysteine-rich domain-containing protein n=1 Tax=Blepharisma stoltei TaxID=1481888 RepID=A0AAU9JLN9_9CILI|nr:unnamed protein product [Blepharisma stoltei]